LLCVSGGSSGRGAADNDEEEGEHPTGDIGDGEEEEEEEEVGQVTAPCNHRVWYSTNHYTQTDPVRDRVQFKTHYEKGGHEVLCDRDCPKPECMNRVRTDLVRVASSELLPGQLGLFSCVDIQEGSVIACFGDVRELRVGEDGKRTRLGYIITVKERGGRTLAITPRQVVTEGCVAHAINHTCHNDFESCKFVHSGITNVPRGGGGQKDEKVARCSRNSVVYVKTTRFVERDVEIFANY
jgi:hypothetical protein